MKHSQAAKPDRSTLAAVSLIEPPLRLFEGLAQSEIDLILAAGIYRRYLANTIIINQEDPADYFFLLIKGCVRLFVLTQKGKKILMRWLMPGEILGGAALLSPPSAYPVSTETVKDSVVFVWRRNTIRALAERYPKLVENALPFALDHLTWFVASHMALVSNSARERLAQVVVSLARGIGRKTPQGLQLDLTNEELANTANITPFTASRLLSEWQQSGAVTKGRGSLILRVPHRLFLTEV